MILRLSELSSEQMMPLSFPPSLWRLYRDRTCCGRRWKFQREEYFYTLRPENGAPCPGWNWNQHL